MLKTLLARDIKIIKDNICNEQSTLFPIYMGNPMFVTRCLQAVVSSCIAPQ